MNNKQIYIKQEAIDGMLDYCKSLHPVEGILIVRGTNTNKEIRIKNLMIPPLPIHNEVFSSFDQYQLPFDSTILGIAHSHPNGVNMPSDTDLLNFFGRLMIILTPPYLDMNDIQVFNSLGNIMKFIIYN